MPRSLPFKAPGYTFPKVDLLAAAELLKSGLRCPAVSSAPWLVLRYSGCMVTRDIGIPHRGVLAVLPLIQLPVSVPWKASEGDTSDWTPVTHMEDLDRVPGSWLQSGPAVAIATI